MIVAVRLAAAVLALTLLGAAARSGAEPLVAGMPMPAITLTDQHDVTGLVSADTRYVLISRDMSAAKVLNEALANDPGLLDAAAAVVVSDISRMPSLITKLFALPAMRKRPYRMLLDRDGKATADLPSENGKVTVLRLHALTIERVEYVESVDALRAALRQPGAN